MRDKVGLWVDDRKAMVVTVPDKGEPMGLTLRRDDLSPGEPDRPGQTAMQDGRPKKSEGCLSRYYDTVLQCLHDAGAILILGPGEAKHELMKRLERTKAGKCIAGVETVDRMTHDQVAAKVRQYFAEPIRSVRC